MLIYIIHFDKIFEFRLSSTVSGKYILTDYDEFGLKRNLVNIEAKDGKYYMYQNKNVTIKYNEEQYDSIPLSLYNFYSLTILGKENVLIYTMPIYDDSFQMVELNLEADQKKKDEEKEATKNKKKKNEVEEDKGFEILVGNTENSDIKIGCAVGLELLKITYKNNKYRYECLNKDIALFVNKQRTITGYLNNFDTIFVLGLKIIVLNNKLLVNKIKNIPLAFNVNKFTEVKDYYLVKNHSTDVRTYEDFYDERDYFFKSPVFKTTITEEKIKFENPPSKEEKDNANLLVTLVPSIVMVLSSVYTTVVAIVSYRNGESSKSDLISSLIMSGGMIFVSIIWPFFERFINNVSVWRKNKKNKKKYEFYLHEKEKELQELNRKQKMILTTNNASYTDCERYISSRSSELFSRSIEDKDFLNVLLGVGNIQFFGSIEYSEPSYLDKNQDLYVELRKLTDKYRIIEQAPFVISLKERNVIAFILEKRELFKEYMTGIILQIMTFHNYNELKLVVLTSSKETELSFVKDSNFCWNDDHTFRFFAETLEEGQQISAYLERELNQRKSIEKSDSDKVDGCYYLIISDSIELYRSLNIIGDVISYGSKNNFGLLMYDLKIANIPSECSHFVSINEKEGFIFESNRPRENFDNFVPSFIIDSNVDADKCVRALNNIPIKRLENNSTLIPNSFAFLQMYNVGNVDQLNVASKWESSNPSSSLAVPLGIDGNGNLVYLDLHEKFHGPHGLIAGMTGSGKSELIITYILSLAVNFRPDEVQFVLIDYKGGGLAGAFENRKAHIKLPHLVGTITNLDKSEMKRTLVSINSELKRRQRQFNTVKESLNTGNMDIYKYQKLHREGVIQEPMSHLFIICDEFAELKAQEPDFMDELVSAARIGRSLGIHLILATQKPSGVVDDQIWSNAKFKICCKVQTEEDSNEMIKKPDASYLRNAGSFYLQVGYDEYFVQGQSAYAGFPYIPSERISVQVDNDITFIDNSGEPYKTIVDSNEVNTKTSDSKGEELINILHYIIDEANKLDFKNQQLWLDNVPTELYYNNVVNKYGIKAKFFDINPVIGEYDDPASQKQSYVTLPITYGGNVAIFGTSGSGKNTLLSTIIYGTIINHNCKEVNIYIIDLGAEKLRKYSNAPQVGEVITAADTDKVKYLFYTLESEQTRRQQYYAKNGGDFFSDIKKGSCPFPNIVVFIYDFDIFKESFDEICDEEFPKFTRSCSKSGINFVITCANASSLGFLLENNFPQKIMLNMIDSTDYTLYFNKPPVPGKNPGRGITLVDENPFEFQVALTFKEDDEIEKINYICEQLNKYLKDPAPPIPVVPNTVKLADMLPYITDLSNVPVGINIITAQVGYINLSNKVTLMSSGDFKSAAPFFNAFISLLIKYNNTNVIVINALKDLNLKENENAKIYTNNFKKVASVINSNIEKYNQQKSDNKYIIIVLGYTKLQNFLSEGAEEDSSSDSIPTIDSMVNNCTNDNFKFIIFDSAILFGDNKDTDLLSSLDFDYGLWIGNGYSSQDFFDVEQDMTEDVKESKDTAGIVKHDKIEFVKFMK